jgi:phosphoglycolate phosphatase-like HAD superfamily hydrolase
MKKNYKVVVFDFDGVLTKGGEELKMEAWNILALPWNYELRKNLGGAVKQYSNGSGSRFDILREVFAGIKASDVVDLLVAAYAECFNVIVQRLLQKSGMPDKTEKTLAELARERELFVNSATPEDAVNESIQNFNIAHYFHGVFGCPSSKVENLKKVQARAKTDKKRILFIGDSDGDWKAAQEFGCDFIGVANDWNKWTPETKPFPLIKSIAELPGMLL